MDQRNIQSRTAIKKALITLSKNRPYSEISIRELCREAGISRSTFYNNYRFFNDVLEEMSEDFMKVVEGQGLSRGFFDTVIAHSDEMRLLLKSGIFGQKFSLYLKNLLMGDKDLTGVRNQEELSLNVKTLYHAYGIFGVLINLIDNSGSPYFDQMYATGIETLMELIRDFTEE